LNNKFSTLLFRTIEASTPLSVSVNFTVESDVSFKLPPILNTIIVDITTSDIVTPTRSITPITGLIPLSSYILNIINLYFI